MALIAYGFGLRHAVNPDHIAAIDNATRKLMQQHQRPVSVGFWFAIGHSTVIVLVAAVIAATSAAMQGRFESAKDIGGVISTSVSAAFLFVIAAINLVVLVSIWRAFRHARRDGAYGRGFDMLLNSRGVWRACSGRCSA